MTNFVMIKPLKPSEHSFHSFIDNLHLPFAVVVSRSDTKPHKTTQTDTRLWLVSPHKKPTSDVKRAKTSLHALRGFFPNRYPWVYTQNIVLTVLKAHVAIGALVPAMMVACKMYALASDVAIYLSYTAHKLFSFTWAYRNLTPSVSSRMVRDGSMISRSINL